jgi:hypothetical protein
MDNVILLKNHLKDFEYLKETGGSYVNGVYVPGSITAIPFTAAPFPIGQLELKLFPQGILNFDDIKIYTKYDLVDAIDKDIKRNSDNKTYRLLKNKPYKEMADLKVYILKRIEGES